MVTSVMTKLRLFRPLTILWFGLCFSTPLVAQTPDLQTGDLVLLGGVLFDATGETSRPNPGILIRNGTILTVGLEVSAAPAGVEVIRLDADQTVLPGFFDLHAHYAVDLFGDGRVDEYEVNPIVFLANGVTSTFSAGEVDPEGMQRARERIAAGEQVGPRLYNSGPYYGTARPGWDHAVMTPDSIQAEVDLWSRRGARGFKAKGIRPEQLAALIEAGHRNGRTVTAHLDSGFRGSVNPRDAVLMGIDRIEHFMGGDAIEGDRPAYSSLEALDLSDPLTATRVRDVIDLYKRHGVFFDATLTAYGYFGEKDPEVYTYWIDERQFFTPWFQAEFKQRPQRGVMQQFERIYWVKRKTLKAFFDAGGGHLITLGTDHPSWGEFVSGCGVHRELHCMVLAGIAPAAALKIATINGARALGVGQTLGTIEPGKLADLVVVRGNPLADIRKTRSTRLVMQSGRIHDAQGLLASARGKIGPADEGEKVHWVGRMRRRRR